MLGIDIGALLGRFSPRYILERSVCLGAFCTFRYHQNIEGTVYIFGAISMSGGCQ